VEVLEATVGMDANFTYPIVLNATLIQPQEPMWKNWLPVIASLGMAIISLILSLLNYYKSLEPSLSITVKNKKQFENVITQTLTERKDLHIITKIFFKNSSNNAFKSLNIYLIFIDASGSIDTKTSPNMYLGPQEERVITFPSETNIHRYIYIDKVAKLRISHDYNFLLKKRSYNADFRWNHKSETWDWSLPPSQKEAKAKGWWQFWK
jgi:hypothetical protein